MGLIKAPNRRETAVKIVLKAEEAPDALTTSGPNNRGRRTKPLPLRLPGERRSVSRSATRALDVLELFGQERRPLRAIEIAKALDLHASTADQLLKTMVGSAHLIFDARSKTYLPSHRLASFSSWLVQSYGSETRLRKLVMDVQEETGELVTLTTPNDLFMQIIDVAGAWPGSEITQRGVRVPIFGTTTGAAYLSSLDDSEIVRLARRARLTRTETTDIRLEVEQFRKAGISEGAWSNGELWTMAAPLPPIWPRPLVLAIAGRTKSMQAKSASLKTVLRNAVASLKDK